VALIESLVRFELSAAVIYDALAQLRLDAPTRDLLAMLSQHERDHAAVLLNAAEYLGGPPQKPPSLQSLQRKSPAVARARTRRDALVLAGGIEGAQLHAYYGAQQELSDSKLLQQTATVMCSEGQHAVLVRAAIGVDPIPSPFELGAV
jgi:rubrerythrin